MFFNVTNEGKGPRFIRSLAGKQVAVLPGEKNMVKLDIDPTMARRLQEYHQRQTGTLLIQALDEAGRDALSGDKAQRSQPVAQPEKVENPYDDPGEIDGAKKELLARADEISIGELRTETGLLLGKKAPLNLNRLNTAAIKNLLR